MNANPRVVAIVAARMTSTRLPGKVLADLCGRPMLEQLLGRLGGARSLDEIIVATTDQPTDDPICALARHMGIASFRGSEHDVLSRFAQCARHHGADIIVRITGDCPLVVPELVDAVVAALRAAPHCDYASNVLERRYPQGLDVEALWDSVLQRIAATASSAMAREHVTWHLVREAPSAFTLRSVPGPHDHSHLRWTVDTGHDLALIRQIYDGLDLRHNPRSYEEILEFVMSRPQLQRINEHVQQLHQ